MRFLFIKISIICIAVKMQILKFLNYFFSIIFGIFLIKLIFFFLKFIKVRGINLTFYLILKITSGIFGALVERIAFQLIPMKNGWTLISPTPFIPRRSSFLNQYFDLQWVFLSNHEQLDLYWHLLESRRFSAFVKEFTN